MIPDEVIVVYFLFVLGLLLFFVRDYTPVKKFRKTEKRIKELEKNYNTLLLAHQLLVNAQYSDVRENYIENKRVWELK